MLMITRVMRPLELQNSCSQPSGFYCEGEIPRFEHYDCNCRDDGETERVDDGGK